MTRFKDSLLIVMALFVLLGAIVLVTNRGNIALGSVTAGNSYESTTTPLGVNDLTNLCPARVGTASSTTGTLGSIVVTGPNVGEILVYDATTSDITLRNNIASSTLILADIAAPVNNNTAGTSTATYTFDIVFKRGILIDYLSAVGLTPTSTLSYRCGS